MAAVVDSSIRRVVFEGVRIAKEDLYLTCLSLLFQINELKRIHQAGGRAVPTWIKQPQDKYTAGFAAVLVFIGVAQLIPGHYRLASGKGKLE